MTFEALPTYSTEYQRAHDRVRSVRGNAQRHRCKFCSRRTAHDWAYIHGLDPWNVQSYSPMCNSCHRKYDNEVRGGNVGNKSFRKLF